MCIGSTPKAPAAPEVQAAPQEQDAAVTSARDDEQRRRRAAAGRNSTLLTGAQGDTSAATTSGKTLLGQYRKTCAACWTCTVLVSGNGKFFATWTWPIVKAASS